MPTDEELRNRVLEHLYKVRHNSPPYINMPEGLNLGVNDQTTLNILNQLKQREWAKWSRISGGFVKGRLQITEKGIQEIEDRNRVVIPPVEIATPSAPPTPTAHPTHTLIVWLTFAVGCILIFAGIALFFMGGDGKTEIRLFGSSFASTNVGISSFFLGMALVLFTFRRVLTSTERMRK